MICFIFRENPSEKLDKKSRAYYNENNSVYLNSNANAINTAIKRIAKDLGLDNGFRIINNCGKDGGQTVGHIHFHLLARRNLQWPPG